MKSNYWWYIFFGLVITLLGILTQKFFFLFLLLPFSLFYKTSNNRYIKLMLLKLFHLNNHQLAIIKTELATSIVARTGNGRFLTLDEISTEPPVALARTSFFILSNT